MAILRFANATTVAELKEAFYDAFGARLRVYEGSSQADDKASLGSLGLNRNCVVNIDEELDVSTFIKNVASIGLKVKVYTCDEWIAVIDELSLEQAGKVKKKAVKADMLRMVGCETTEEQSKSEATNVKKSTTYGDYTISILANNSVSVVCQGENSDNTKAALRQIADQAGFAYEKAWTTQQFGSKLVDFLNANSTKAPATKPGSNKSQKQHICVKVEIDEHDYAAFDGNEEMLDETFAFNGDGGPDYICITVDGKEIEFDEDELADRSKYSDYESFDMEKKWNSEDMLRVSRHHIPVAMWR